MDPLSITAAVVGLIGAVESVSSILKVISSSITDVPRVMTSLFTEAKELQLAVSVLYRLIRGVDRLSKRRTRLISLEQLMATLTETVLTISEIEAQLKTIASRNDRFSLYDRVKVAFALPGIKTLVGRLQRNKASLNLMFNILQWYGAFI